MQRLARFGDFNSRVHACAAIIASALQMSFVLVSRLYLDFSVA